MSIHISATYEMDLGLDYHDQVSVEPHFYLMNTLQGKKKKHTHNMLVCISA